MKEEKEIQRKIEEKFKAVLDRSQEHPALRHEVFMTITQIEVAAELIDFFTIKMVLSEGVMFQSNTALDELEHSSEEE